MSDSREFEEMRRDVEKVNKQVDIFRDTAVRYCGYSNEVGESFRPIIHRSIVQFSYAIAIVYVIADCADKTIKIYQVSLHTSSIHRRCELPPNHILITCISYSQSPEVIGGKQIGPAAKIAGDVFLWQMFASVIIPGAVINRITWAAGKLCNNPKVKGMARKWAPTCIGLAAIPFIIRPIDVAVDEVMDNTYRKHI